MPNTTAEIRQYQLGDRVRRIHRNHQGQPTEPFGPVCEVVGWDDRTGNGRTWFTYHLRNLDGRGGTTVSDHLLVPAEEQ